MPITPSRVDVLNEFLLHPHLEQLTEYVHESIFKFRIPASSMYTSCSRAVIATYRSSVIVWPDGSKKKDASVSFPRPTFWFNGEVKFTLQLALSAAHTGGNERVRLKQEFWVHKTADVLSSGGTQIATTSESKTFTTQGLQTISDQPTTLITSDHDVITASYERDNTHGDENFTGKIYVVSLEVEYFPRFLQ